MGKWIEGTDDHGQPLEKGFHARRVAGRTMDEMLGICKGIISDGVVVPKEAEFLKGWLANNPEVASVWPAKVLGERLSRIYADGQVDDEELEDLRELLAKATGETSEGQTGERKSTQLPLDDPAPEVAFTGTLFCFTGKFAFGTRKACESAVIDRGGECQKQPSHQTSYLVIGTLGSRDWIHTSHGRKIEAANQFKADGVAETAIIDEEHWSKNL